MKLHDESALKLDSLKGAFVFKKTKEGKEITYRIYDFHVDLEPDWGSDGPLDTDRMVGFELTEICVTLVPVFSDGSLNTEEMEGRSWRVLKDYTIQFPGAFPNKISNEIK